MPTMFQRRILAERTQALATRGIAVADDLLPPRLVCLVGDQHIALPVELVASMRPFACNPVPLLKARAVGTMLGVSLIGRKLYSVLDCRRLLAIGGAEQLMTGGTMLLLRSIEPPVALRVDRVQGVLRLAASTEPGRAILTHAAASETDLPPLVMLVDLPAIVSAISALDDV